MSAELKNAYNNLDINNKRNKLSDELIVIYELIKKFQNLKGIEPVHKVKNYDLVEDSNLSEDEMLTFLYEDVFNIELELLMLLRILQATSNENA